MAASKLEDIRVVPNPYFGHSSYEITQFNRIIKFINLPEKCKIRIFNLSGVLIRTLEKDDPSTSIATWDVLTESHLTPASGIYIYHIKKPIERLLKYIITTSMNTQKRKL